MANRTFYPSFSYGFGRVYLDVRFTCNGASAPLLTSVVGSDSIASFAHVGATNVITVNFKDPFFKVCFASAEFLVAASVGSYCSINTIANEGTASGLQVALATFVAAGTALNDAASTYQIGVSMALINSSSGLK